MIEFFIYIIVILILQMALLKRNSIIYRATDKFENYIPNYDGDTGKTGLYFANYQALSLGMCLEYKREEMLFCTYIVLEDIELSIGKYGFRDIDPSVYYTEDGYFIPDTIVPDDHNLSHFDSELYPIIADDDYDFEIVGSGFGEVFIAEKDMKKIKIIDIEKCYYNTIKKQFDTIGITSDSVYI